MTHSLSPLPPASLDWALFLDFDGTLAPLAPHPDAVTVPPSLVHGLEGLSRSLDGAVAVVSGRPVSQIDGFLAPLRLAVAGKHGLESRLPGGRLETATASNPALARVKARLGPIVAADPRLLLEDKVQTIALHYRQAPEREAECERLVKEAVKREDGDLQVLHGKMVVEVKPAGINKGVAIARLMEAAPFAGRRPVFAGDDVTDEDGFRAVNAMGGISIRIGPGATAATHRAPGDAEFVAWLGRVNHTLAALAVQKKGTAS
jgi:trehalose 6-phosphate phosphatase